jgi:hypothetical protein
MSGIDGAQDSLLTDRYRETLEMQPESNKYVRDTRSKMRQRVRTGLYDFTYLNQYAEQRDIDEIFHLKHEIPQRKGVEPDSPDTSKIERISDTDLPGQFTPVRHIIEFVYRGMRSAGIDRQEFAEKVLAPALMYGEAKHKDVDPAIVESEIDLTLEVHNNAEEMDPIEKWKHDVPLSKEEFAELYDRLPEVEGERDISAQIKEHLIDE